jgi:hypothetical protein
MNKILLSNKYLIVTTSLTIYLKVNFNHLFYNKNKFIYKECKITKLILIQILIQIVVIYNIKIMFKINILLPLFNKFKFKILNQTLKIIKNLKELKVLK